MKKFILSVSFLLIGGLSLYSQGVTFSDSLFLYELDAMWKGVYDKHDEVEDVYETFKTNWESGNLDNSKSDIVQISNSMKKLRMKPYPDFYNYILTINGSQVADNLQFYVSWMIGLKDLLKLKKSPVVSNYLSFSNNFINDSILVKTSVVTWKALTNNYDFAFDTTSHRLSIKYNNDFDLIFYNSTGHVIDTAVISETRGVCYPMEQKWEGTHGFVRWQSTVDKSIFAEFKTYELDLRQRKIKIENSLFTNKNLNLTKVQGRVEEKLVQSSRNEETSVFYSYNRLMMKDILKDIDFWGYFRMQGANFIGVDSSSNAVLYVRDGKTNISVLRSNHFEIKPDSTISCPSANVVFYLDHGRDSIWHKSLNVRYQNRLDSALYKPDWFNFDMSSGNYMILSRSRSGLGATPFKDTYHELNIYSDRLIWRRSDSLLYIVTTKSGEVDYVTFQSSNYFDAQEYDRFSKNNVDNINHLVAIRNLYSKIQSQSVGGIQLTPRVYQKYIHQTYSKNIKLSAIEVLFQNLSYSDFIFYDRNSKTVVPTEKLSRSISNSTRARLRKKQVVISADSTYLLEDYDNIVMTSQRGQDGIRLTNIGVNATINNVNNNLVIRYLKPFKLSPSVKVFSDEITIRKDRNLLFGGDLGAGLMKLTGSKFEYNYKNNNIKIEDKNTTIEMWSKDTVNNQIKYSPVSTKMTNIEGTLSINTPDNKSNTIRNENFPKIETDKKARIYYEEFASKYWSSDDTTKSKSFNDMFYFEADNFSMDSLNSLSDSTIQYKGKMHTGLFEPLDVTITIKTNAKDGTKSLGFTECTSDNADLKSGLEFKGGRFFGCFSLNNQGLYGDGYILYASSFVHSNNFAFMPNEVIATVDSFAISRQIGAKSNSLEDVPNIVGKNVYFSWSDAMLFSKDKKHSKAEMIFYSDKLKNPGNLIGSMKYTNNSITGSGSFEFLDANIIDTNFTFKSSNFVAPTCDFDLKIKNRTTFKTRNLNGDVDIDEGLGSFYSNEDTSHIVFPDNKYICIMDHFLWKIGEGIVNIGGVMPGQDKNQYAGSLEEKIEMKRKNKDIKLFGTIMVGMADTLQFKASSTTYILESKIIEASDVGEIKIADAMIYPRGTVTIRKAGRIDTLKNISLDYPYELFSTNKKSDYLHSFSSTDVVIFNRFNYKALKPTYYYKYKKQPLEMSYVEVKDAPTYSPNKIQKSFNNYDLESVATMKFTYGDSVLLSDNFVYEGQGKINVFAREREPRFEGYARIDTSCSPDVPIYVFKLPAVKINSDSVVLPIESPAAGRSGKILTTGLFWETTRVKNKSAYNIRHNFLGKRIPNSDSIFQADGQIIYHKQAGEYRIGNINKISVYNPDSIQGNMMSYNTNLCLLKAQGEFNFFQNWDVRGQKEINHIKSKFTGFYRCDLSAPKDIFQGTWAFDFIAPEAILNDMVDKILLNEENEPIIKEKNRMKKNYYLFMGKDKTNKIFDDLENYFEYDQPEDLKHTIMFSDISLTWSLDSSSLFTTKKIGIASINGKKVDRYVNGYVKYKNGKKVRMLIIIIEPIPGVLYAFKYRYSEGNGIMKIYTKTGNLDIDNYMDNMKDRDKSFKNNYKISKTSEPEFRSFAKEYIKKKRN